MLEKVEGRRLLFTVSVRDHRGLVACGKVTRVIVDAERFLEKLSRTARGPLGSRLQVTRGREPDEVGGGLTRPVALVQHLRW